MQLAKKGFIQTNPSRFTAIDSDGAEYVARKVVLATGVTDILPDIKGLSDVWGSAAFSCSYCDLYEHLNGPVAFLGLDSLATVLNSRKLKNNGFVILTNGTSPENEIKKLSEKWKWPELEALITKFDVKFETRAIESFSAVDPYSAHSSILVKFSTDKPTIYAGALVSTKNKPTGDLHNQLRLQTDPKHSNPKIAVENKSNGLTNVTGVYVVGDAVECANFFIVAIRMGKNAAMHIVYRLSREDGARGKD